MKSKKIKTKKLQERKKQQKLFLLKTLLITVSTTIIVYFIPRTNGFNYNYELNQPWRYGALLSSQKFNILMSDSAASWQRDSIIRCFKPYYQKDNIVKTNVLQTLNSIGSKVQVRKLTMNLVASYIDSVYAHGVITSQQLDSLQKAGTSQVRVVTDNMAMPVDLQYLMTPKSAYQFIVSNVTEVLDENVTSELALLNINAILTTNLTSDYVKNESELEMQFSSMSSSIGFVRANEKIVDRGEIVDKDIYQKLRSYERAIDENGNAEQQNNMVYSLPGQIVIVLTIFSLLMAYLSIYRKDYLENKRNSILLYSLVVVFFIAASLMVSHHFFHIFILPCCMVPIIIRTFLDSRTAFTFHCAMVLLISLILSNPYDFMILQLIAGLLAILDLRELTQRSQIIHAAVAVILIYILFYCAYQLATGTTIDDIDRRHLIYFAINGVLLLFTYPLLWLVEKIFGFVSDVTLVELSNINHPLLRKLSEEAPGTFQHSMQVANLAADVAKKIDAKVQLVRTGALYHDIGKIDRPVFFTENQSGVSPHKHLSPMKSAEVIIAHVAKGLDMADQYSLPQAIKDFISTHHGIGKTKYFLVTYKNEHPDEEVDEGLFTYPGPNPKTKEEAILMMSDAIEASSRSLQEYTEGSISELVDKIIDSQVNEGYFRECPLTFRDITNAKEVFKNRLMNIYHTRISYPELMKNV